jgi:Holliday junction DNA helicase RuvB
MEDFQIDIMIGSGTWATTIQMPIPPFTLVWATTKLSKLSAPLRDRFGSIIKLDYYSSEELQAIVRRSFSVFELAPPNDTIVTSIASRSRGTPRITNRYVKVLRDYIISGAATQTSEAIEWIFEQIGINKEGLDQLDQKYLHALEKNFWWWPVWLSALAAIVGEESSTLEEVVEPFLMQLGYIERSTQGRSLTDGYYTRNTSL